jgi:peptide deformylase
MAVRKIVAYTENEASLRKKSEPVRAVNQRVKNLIKDLKETLLSRPEGIGLAAPQINVHQRIIVVRLGGHGDNGQESGPPLVLVNPLVLELGDEQRDFDGCLSFPGLYGETIRPHYLHVTGLTEWGKPFDRVFKGFDAVVVHHEIDHLDGIVFIDRIKNTDDLYRVRKNEKGEMVRIPAVGKEA